MNITMNDHPKSTLLLWLSFSVLSLQTLFATPSNHPHSLTEICDNNIDDDGDGLIDIFDDECICNATTNFINVVPNGDFETYSDCCSSIDSQSVNCLSNWVHLSGSPDYYNENCLDPISAQLLSDLFGVNIEGGFLGSVLFEGSINPPDESLGNCLDQTLQAGETYTFSFDLAKPNDNLSEIVNMVFVGISNCSDLASLENTSLCNSSIPTETFATINVNTLAPGWNHFEFQITPLMDIEAIYYFRGCNQNPAPAQYPNVIMDNLSILAPAANPTILEISQGGIPCESSLNFSVEDITTSTYQWYFNQSPILGATDNILPSNQIYQNGEGEYHVNVTHSDGSCRLIGAHTFAEPSIFFTQVQTICEGASYNFLGEILTEEGNYLDTIVNLVGCDSAVLLILKIDTTCTATEICNNGLDDDGDGLIDFQDDDCNCNDAVLLNPIDIINNPDWEEHVDCCFPNTIDCVDDWVMIHPSLDYYHEDCTDSTSYAHSFLAGDAFIGSHFAGSAETMESFGTCFTQPLSPNLQYELSFEARVRNENPGPLMVGIYGVLDCNDLTLQTDLNLCGNPDFIELAHWEITSNTDTLDWTAQTISFVADQAYAGFVFHRSCAALSLPGDDAEAYVFYDDFQIAESDSSVVVIESEGQFCTGDLVLSNTQNFNANYQWYHNGMALVGETSAELTVTESGEYFLVITDATGNCKTSNALHTDNIDPTQVIIFDEVCQGNTYNFFGNEYDSTGIYNHLQSSGDCDTLFTLVLEVPGPIIGEYEFVPLNAGDIYIFNGDTLSETGVYFENFVTAEGCDSVNILDIWVLPSFFVEDCFNGIDDDGDGLIDAFDDDCECIVTIPTNLVPNGDFENTSGCCFAIPDEAVNCVNDWQYLHLTPDYVNEDCLSPPLFIHENYYGVPLDNGMLSTAMVNENGQISSESMGVCLEQPMIAGQTYSISLDLGRSFDPNLLLSESMHFTLNGIPECNDLQNYITDTSLCNSGFPFEQLFAIDLFPLNPGWNTFQFSFTPTMDLEAIFIFGDCNDVSSSLQFAAVFFDNLVILPDTPPNQIEEVISQSGIPCENSFQLSVENIPTSTYQWYFNEMPIAGATQNTLSSHEISLNGEGEYHVYVIHSDGSCQLIGPYSYTSSELFSTINETICENGTYFFAGENLNMAGMYQDTIASSYGCDSIITLNLNTIDAFQTSVLEKICEGETYFFNGENLNMSGVYGDTLSTVNGCDSFIYLTLILNQNEQFNFQQSICGNETYFFGGENLNTTGIYTDTLQTIEGCDSIVTLDLLVFEYSENTISETLCTGETFLFEGNELSTAGTYTETFTNAIGCDSVVTLHLDFHDQIVTYLFQEICEGESYFFNNQFINLSGSYEDTLSTTFGCDSIISLNLVVLQPTEFNFQQSICENETYFFGGENLNTAGIYTDTLQTIEGCDSMVTLDLSVFENSENAISETLCSGQTYSFGGTELSIAGTYIDTFTNANGCDSVVTLNLDFHDQIVTYLFQEICEGESYFFNNQFINLSGSYEDTLSTTLGCDSIISLNLVVLQPTEFNFQQSICENETYFFGGENLSITGTYTDTLQNIEGCDSIVSLDLTVFEISEIVLSEELCDGETYTFDNQNITTNGTYEAIFTSATNGCDSIVTLNISFLPPIEGDILFVNQLIGTSYTFHGTTYDSAGFYEATLTAANGCDSIAYLDLSLTAPCSQPIEFSIEIGKPSCEEAENGWVGIFAESGTPPFMYSIDGGDNFVSTNLFQDLSVGDYNIIITDSFGCQVDTFLTLENESANLFIQLPPDTIVELGQSVHLFIEDLNFTPTEYFWNSNSIIHCLTCEEINVTPTSSDTYQLTVIDENGCETFDEIFIEVKEKQTVYIPNAFSPNDDGNNDFFKAEASPEVLERIVDMRIFNRWGEVVFQQAHDGSLDVPKWNGTFNGKIAPIGVYIYTITWKTTQGKIEILSGDLTLVR